LVTTRGRLRRSHQPTSREQRARYGEATRRPRGCRWLGRRRTARGWPRRWARVGWSGADAV
jgi:hypothetical protein